MLDYIYSHYYEFQFAASFGGMFLLFILEAYYPRRISNINQTSRWTGNISLALLNHFALIFHSLLVIAFFSQFQPDSPLLKHFGFSDLTSLLFLFLIYEFISYWSHRAFHHFPLLWRIHSVHHSDTEIDVTTALRIHPFEGFIFNTIIGIPLLMLLGAPLISLVWFNMVRSIVQLTSHSNIVIPKKLDSIIRLFILTPDYHRMHHSSNQRFTDSNFSVVFPIFDYVFRTATKKSYDEISEMEIGLEKLREEKDQRFDKLVLQPFTYK